MIATVRLSSELEDILNSVSKKFHKKKSDVIREAIRFYAKDLEKKKKSRIEMAMSKAKEADLKEYKSLVTGLDDGL